MLISARFRPFLSRLTGDEDMRLQAMRGGAVKFMVKPFDCAALLECVRVALEG